MSLPNRILFNGDVNYLFATDYRRRPDLPGPYTAQVLDDHVDLLAESGVDTFVINVNAQVPWYPSRRLAHVLTGYARGDAGFCRGHYPPVGEDFSEEQLAQQLRGCVAMLDRYLDPQEAGVDWLAHLIAACRRRGVTPWVSIRMNDAHGANGWATSFMNCPPQRDPRLRLRGAPMHPRAPAVRNLQVCDYAHREVRDYYFAMIEELVEDYDLDGVELDWLRMPLCCNPPASPDEIAMMIDWHRQIRELTGQRARRSGRPCPLGLRVPARLAALRTHGVDAVEMARRGVVDSLAPSNFWQTSWDLPYDRLRARVGPDVTLFGVVEDAPNWLFARGEDGEAHSYRLLSHSPELIRGNAAGKLATGADGIEFYNFFCSRAKSARDGGTAWDGRYDAIAGIANLDGLRGLPKHYALQTTFNYWSPAFTEYAGQLPACVETGGWRTFHLAMCREPAGMTLVVQLVIDRDGPPPDLGVSVNGCWPVFDAEATDRLLFPCGPLVRLPAHYLGLTFRLPAEALEDGLNEIVVYDGHEDRSPAPDRAVRQTRIVSLEAGIW